MLDLKWGVLMAGIVVDMKTWKRIPKKYHEDLISISRSIQGKYAESNSNADVKALEAMKQYEKTYKCYEFIGPSPIDYDN